MIYWLIVSRWVVISPLELIEIYTSMSNNRTGREYTDLSAERVDIFCSSRRFSGSAPGKSWAERNDGVGRAGWLACLRRAEEGKGKATGHLCRALINSNLLRGVSLCMRTLLSTHISPHGWYDGLISPHASGLTPSLAPRHATTPLLSVESDATWNFAHLHLPRAFVYTNTATHIKHITAMSQYCTASMRIILFLLLPTSKSPSTMQHTSAHDGPDAVIGRALAGFSAP
jgi:hypothetical protein